MPSTQAATSSQHLGSLDGLRGAMALWVLTGHVFTSTGATRIPVIASPSYAVDGFMLLSGFLMTWHYSLRAEKEPWTSWRTWAAFWVRRFFRISPLYYLLLIPSYIMIGSYAKWQETTHHLQRGTGNLNLPITWQHVLSHVTYAFGVMPKFHSSLPLPDWSISLEMQFYLAFPFLMLLVLRFGWPIFCIFAGLVWTICNMPSMGLVQAYSGLPSPLWLSLLWFAVGMIWAGGYASSGAARKRAIVMGLGLCLLSRDIHDISLIAVFALILFLGDVPVLGPIIARLRLLLSGRIAKFMADSSYVVYLVHLLILRALAYALLVRTGLSPNERGIVAFVLTVAASYSLAALLGPVERWGISVGRRVSSRISAIGRRTANTALGAAKPEQAPA